MGFNKKILLLGQDGQVGSELRSVLEGKYDYISVGRNSCDLEKAGEVRSCIEKYKPEIIINAAAYTNVDEAETDPYKAIAVNWYAVQLIAECAAKMHSTLIHYSTDYVYDGTKLGFWKENDLERPINKYGESKLRGDNSIRIVGSKHLIIRSSWIYSEYGQNFAKNILSKSMQGEQINVVDDVFGVPTSGKLLADTTLKMIDKITDCDQQYSLYGTYNVVPKGSTNWYEYAHWLLKCCEEKGIPIQTKSNMIKRAKIDDYCAPAKRPKNSRLCVKKLEKNFGIKLDSWKIYVQEFVAQLEKKGKI